MHVGLGRHLKRELRGSTQKGCMWCKCAYPHACIIFHRSNTILQSGQEPSSPNQPTDPNFQAPAHLPHPPPISRGPLPQHLHLLRCPCLQICH